MTIIICHTCGKPWKRNSNDIRCNPCGRIVERGFGRAHGAVLRAVKRGDLPNLRTTEVACVDCGKRAIRYDHRDYLKRLDVEPVCQACNRRRGPGANLLEASA
jgi:DNA-directed RNA polymerase subunit RPC12/RpoP